LLIDARTVPKNQVIDTEVCMVGAGAAGITMAREFVGQEFRVCLLESGSLEFDEGTQSLYKGKNIGHSYPLIDLARLRYFGGTTNHWGGMCRPLDEIDFEKRDWVAHSGWPFRKSDLTPFYERAQAICQLGPFAYDAEFWEDTQNSPSLPFTGNRVLTKVYQLSPPTRFGKVYRDEIMHADNFSTYLHANVVDIETTETAKTVNRLRVATLHGNKFWVSAKIFILAMGGLENARVLLLSNKIQKAGLGNQNDSVGRFFMDHPHVVSGVFLPSTPNLPFALYSPHKVNKTQVWGTLTLAEEVLRDEKLLNFTTFLQPLDKEAVKKGVASLKFLYRRIRDGEIPDDFWKHLGNVISDIDDVAITVYGKMFNRNRPFILYNRVEQAPNPDSRVTLVAERDSLGQNRIQLDWRLSAIEKQTIRRAQEVIGQELGRAGLGRLRVTLDNDDPSRPPLLEGGWHHMGTTRMHIDPKKGVVNENCRVHGISNLFIAGSSVFPTGGSANPTLTIVALAVRLADHVKKLMT